MKVCVFQDGGLIGRQAWPTAYLLVEVSRARTLVIAGVIWILVMDSDGWLKGLCRVKIGRRRIHSDSDGIAASQLMREWRRVAETIERALVFGNGPRIMQGHGRVPSLVMIVVKDGEAVIIHAADTTA